MYTKILIPLDGSKTAEKVLPYARSFARHLGSTVELVGVIDVAGMVTQMPPSRASVFDAMIEEDSKRSEAYLANISKTFPEGIAVRHAVKRGKPEEVIIELAAKDSNTLIAMATHGRSGVSRWFLGSVTEKILRGTANHLLLVRSPEAARSEGEATLNAVIVPLDGSKLAESVLTTVGRLAKSMALNIELYQAYHIPYTAYGGSEDSRAIDVDAVKAKFKHASVAYLQRKAQELEKQGFDKVSHLEEEGFAAQQIISLAGRKPNNLIAMCTHGRSGVSRWVLGSVTEKVVRYSGDPVLVIPAEAALRDERRAPPSEAGAEIGGAFKYTLD